MHAMSKTAETEPAQRFMMEMSPGILMMHCARRDSTDQMVQDFMRILLRSEHTEPFFILLAEQMTPYLTESGHFGECKELNIEGGHWSVGEPLTEPTRRIQERSGSECSGKAD